ncbi:5-methylcytosine-specific restriction enzyme A [Cryptosporangium aurantiacum]|uniref:5-methylcytosine-specific restriction enzyme A n=2 Tax=Cryptosporangium aurantiacum TaxID=134849 RepID=A0A1M7RJX7_9ACTN|nr:5-methylcytosine-specific restriction enzyme A [Cryptosporangium aurantiacum]
MTVEDAVHYLARLRLRRAGGSASVHQPIVLLWAAVRAAAGEPRLVRWDSVRTDLSKAIVAQLDGDSREASAAYPVLALKASPLWDLEAAHQAPPAHGSGAARWLNDHNPQFGLSASTYALLATDADALDRFALAAVDKLDGTRAQQVLNAFGITVARPADSLPPPPVVGQAFPGRRAIAAVWGGNFQGGMATFPREAERVVNIFSDDNGPYPDRRVPGSGRIEYVGQGQEGPQKLSAQGNALMEWTRAEGKAARYWHRPVDGPFTFEHWVTIVGRHREWQRDRNNQWRIVYVYDLAPVGSPHPEEWPIDVAAEVASRSIDDTVPAAPPDTTALDAPTRGDLYRNLTARATARSGRPAGVRTATEYARSAAAREAVILRASGSCENPACTGMPCDVRPDGTALLEVDHVEDLARGGPDEPVNMIALCPNCHAAKTRGANRAALRSRLRVVARRAHAAALEDAQ